MTEDDGVMAWAYSLLTADSVLVGLVGTRIYDSLAPQGTESDYIILSEQSYNEAGTSIRGDLGCGMMSLLAKAVTKSAGYATASAINKRISAVLNKASGSSGDVTIKSCIRQGKVRYIEANKDGIRYNHVGCIFNVFVSQ